MFQRARRIARLAGRPLDVFESAREAVERDGVGRRIDGLERKVSMQCAIASMPVAAVSRAGSP